MGFDINQKHQKNNRTSTDLLFLCNVGYIELFTRKI